VALKGLAKEVNDAAAAVARAVRLKDPKAERLGRIDLHRAHAKVFQLKAAERLALAEMLEDEGKRAS
jgi:hypothetical protein